MKEAFLYKSKNNDFFAFYKQDEIGLGSYIIQSANIEEAINNYKTNKAY